MNEKSTLLCGLIMPISGSDGCSEQHWSEVKEIITSSVISLEEYDFEVKMVSEADNVGVIQKRIVQQVYSSNIVICDVSTLNPNVMFELGMRLAFDKPTIIIKDDKTDYSFDTGIIEHIEYPRDLRFSSIVAFKEKLARKLVATYEESVNNPEHSTFLKNFGKFSVAKLDETLVTENQLIIEMITDLQREVRRSRSRAINSPAESLNVILKTQNGIKIFMEAEQISRPEDIVDKNELFRFLEEYIDAGNYFNNPRAFKAFIDNIISSWK